MCEVYTVDACICSVKVTRDVLCALLCRLEVKPAKILARRKQRLCHGLQGQVCRYDDWLTHLVRTGCFLLPCI